MFSKAHRVGFMSIGPSVRCISASTRAIALTMTLGPMMGMSHLRNV